MHKGLNCDVVSDSENEKYGQEEMDDEDKTLASAINTYKFSFGESGSIIIGGTD